VPLLRPDPAQRGRLEEIRANLHDRIAEAEREGWLGEIEGLKVSFAGTEDKLARSARPCEPPPAAFTTSKRGSACVPACSAPHWSP
jgi:hypothetical protein